MVYGRLVLVRHGQSLSNKSRKYTGWDNPGLSELGHRQAAEAGRLIKQVGIRFDAAFCSRLVRTSETMEALLTAMGQWDLPVNRRWQLNERHVGLLQGMTKDDVMARYGELQVRAWRFGQTQAPPPLSLADPRHPCNDSAYTGISRELLPSTESLVDTRARVEPCWNGEILPLLAEGGNIVVAGHGVALWALASLALAKAGLELPVIKMPNADPLVLNFDRQMHLLLAGYLGASGAALPKNFKYIAGHPKEKAVPFRQQ